MAQKRMFTMKIVDSDSFLDMPLSTQCLYFHLNMRADDDGFIGNPKKIMRMIGASEDDLKILLAKRFLLIFEESVVVIKHWWMHNTLAKDRYHETSYTDEKALLKIKENKSYTFGPEGQAIKAIGNDTKMLTECYQNDNAGLGQDLDKGLVVVDNGQRQLEIPSLEEVKKYCAELKTDFDALYFYDYYRSRDWMLGKDKMKDWRAVLRNWKRKDDESALTQEEKSKTKKEWTCKVCGKVHEYEDMNCPYCGALSSESEYREVK